MSVDYLVMAAAGAARGPITLVGSSTADSSNAGATLVINKPAGVISGDILISVVCGGGTAITWTGDTGWTEVLDQNASPNLRVAYKIAGGSEASSYTFTGSSAVNKCGVIVAYRNATYAQIGAVSSVASAGGIVTAPSVTVAAGSSVLLGLFGNHQGSSFPAPSGMTSVASINSGTNPTTAVFSQAVNSGATGTKTSDPSGSGNGSGVLLVLGQA